MTGRYEGKISFATMDKVQKGENVERYEWTCAEIHKWECISVIDTSDWVCLSHSP